LARSPPRGQTPDLSLREPGASVQEEAAPVGARGLDSLWAADNAPALAVEALPISHRRVLDAGEQVNRLLLKSRGALAMFERAADSRVNHRVSMHGGQVDDNDDHHCQHGNNDM